MNFDIVQIVGHMGVFDQGIFVFLMLMAAASLIVFFERVIAFGLSASQSRRFASMAGGLMREGKHAELLEKSKGVRSSHLAQLLRAGLTTYLDERVRPDGKVSPIELTRRELVRKTEALGADIRRGMSVLASVGSIAPFVGLLGTVMGIINSFQSIAKQGSGGLGTVSAGISEALVVTAAGLVVAIPAVLAFNYLTGRAEALVRGLDLARGEFLDALENLHGHARLNGAAPTVSGTHGVAQAVPGAPMVSPTQDAREVARV